ncbi:MAG: S24/S26 family peptidase [Lentisphaeraceae bacterium]|nr:S24/S26 family peptidase [Lentisphaeraceae bacterium]
MIQQALQQWMDDKGLTLMHVAEISKSSHTSVRRWLEGAKIRKKYLDFLLPHLEKYIDNKIPESHVPFEIKEAYELLKRSVSNKHLIWLITQNIRNIVNTFKEIEQSKPYQENKIIRFEVAEDAIPFLPQEVSAGNGVEVLEERYHSKPGMHMLKVRGESMQPTYSEGDRVIIQRFIEPIVFGDEHLPLEIIKNMVPENSIIVYNRNDTGLSIKRVKYEKGKNTWYLKLTADNEEWAREERFKRMIKMTDEFIIYGLVVGKQQ